MKKVTDIYFAGLRMPAFQTLRRSAYVAIIDFPIVAVAMYTG